MKKLALILATFLIALGTFALSANPAQAETYQVKMGSDKAQLVFEPAQFTVHPGDTVEFVMNKVAPHNVVFDPTLSADAALAKSFSMSKLLFAPGTSYSVTIPEDAEKGAYPFYCTPHRGAGMNGKMIVE